MFCPDESILTTTGRPFMETGGSLKSFISEMFNKTTEAKEVKILDNEEVSNKMKAIEESIEESSKAILELNGSIVEKDGYIATLEAEIAGYKVAKLEGVASDVVPSKDPSPKLEEKSENAWDSIASSIAGDSRNYFTK